MKRVAILLLCLVFAMTTCVMPAFADEKVNVTTHEVDALKVLTVAGNAKAIAGTNVFVVVGYPKTDLADDIAAGADLDEVAITLDQVTLDASKEFSYTYDLDDNEKSGMLPVYVTVYGFETVLVEARFENADRAAAAVTAISNPSADDDDIYDALVEYDTDINIENGNLFCDTLDATGKEYVAKAINRTSITDLTSLQDAFDAEISKHLTFLEMKDAETPTLKALLEANLDVFDLNASDKTAYNGYNTTKKENTIIALAVEIKDCDTPDDLKDAFDKAVEKGGKTTAAPGANDNRPSGNVSSSWADVGATGDNVTLQPEGDLFTDLTQTEWARTAVETLAKEGVINGKGNGKFAPNDKVTREEFVKMLILAFGLEAEGSDVTFADCDKNAWYYKYIVSGVKQGVINGISAEKFGIGQNITRQDMAVLIYRAAVTDGTVAFYHAHDISFSDVNSISDYAKEPVLKLAEANFLNGMGDGTFAPLANCTRAEAAVALYNILYK